MKRFFYSTMFMCACFSPTMAADEEILLDPLAPRQTAFEVPLFGYKRFPEKLFAVQKGDNFGLPIELIYASASKVPAIEEAAAASGRDVFDLEASEIIALARSKKDEFKGDRQTFSGTTTIVPWAGAPEVDAEFVTALVSSELIESSFSVFNGEIIGEDVEMLSINKDVGVAFWRSYSNLRDLKSYDPSERPGQFEYIQTTLDQYPALLEAAKITFSPVSFGEIFVFLSADRDLNVPPPIDRKYDVYWVEFPLSLRDLEDDYVTEVSFHVFLPDDSRALDLIPWRVGTEATITEEISSPTITVKEIAVGEFYKKTVAYTTLRPTIVATGLREPKFSWILSGEAASTGSYLFVVVLGVPKGQCRISAGLGVNAETTDILGLQGDVAGTGVILTEINLPC